MGMNLAEKREVQGKEKGGGQAGRQARRNTGREERRESGREEGRAEDRQERRELGGAPGRRQDGGQEGERPIRAYPPLPALHACALNQAILEANFTSTPEAEDFTAACTNAR